MKICGSLVWARRGQRSRHVTHLRVGALLFLLLGLLPSAWSLPVSVARDEWFRYAAVATSLAPTAVMDFQSGTTAVSATTATSVFRTGGADPFISPNNPAYEYTDWHNRMDEVPRRSSGDTFFTGKAAASLSDGAAHGVARLGWGDGKNTLKITAALGDIVTVAPGGDLNVQLRLSSLSTSTIEHVTPHSPFFLEEADLVNYLVSIGSDCEAIFVFFACSGPDHGFGVNALITATLGVWDYAFQSDSPFSRFGQSATVDCAGAVICQTLSIHEELRDEATPGYVEVEQWAPNAWSFWENGGLGYGDAWESLSKGSGGKYYVGAQLDIELKPEVSVWGSMENSV
jgi:hypothetical protein